MTKVMKNSNITLPIQRVFSFKIIFKP